MIQFQDKRSSALLGYRNRAETTVLLCEQMPVSGMVFVSVQELSGTACKESSAQ